MVIDMNCLKYKKLLVEFADGNLDYRQSVDVQAHIVQCESCKEELDRLNASLEMIRSDNVLMKEHIPPADFPERIIEKLRHQENHNLLSGKFALSIAFTISILCLGLGLFLNFNKSERENNYQAYSINSAKTRLPQKIKLSKEQSIKSDNQTSKKLPKIKDERKNINAKFNKNGVKANNVNLRVKLEIVELLGQTLELIEGDEKEWEIEI